MQEKKAEKMGLTPRRVLQRQKPVIMGSRQVPETSRRHLYSVFHSFSQKTCLFPCLTFTWLLNYHSHPNLVQAASCRGILSWAGKGSRCRWMPGHMELNNVSNGCWHPWRRRAHMQINYWVIALVTTTCLTLLQPCGL